MKSAQAGALMCGEAVPPPEWDRKRGCYRAFVHKLWVGGSGGPTCDEFFFKSAVSLLHSNPTNRAFKRFQEYFHKFLRHWNIILQYVSLSCCIHLQPRQPMQPTSEFQDATCAGRMADCRTIMSTGTGRSFGIFWRQFVGQMKEYEDYDRLWRIWKI